MKMINTPNADFACSRYDEPSYRQAHLSTLKLTTPTIEEIARVIWQRQHDALASDAISHDVKWRDESIPCRFWDEFLLDAQAVLMLLYKKHIEHENRPF
jgi:6-pyruvoyl-tetrahydropterin synthase